MPLKMYTISHDRNRCIGCGSCVLEAPQTWKLESQDGLSTLTGGKCKNGVYVKMIDEFDFIDNKRAADNCPVHAIRINVQGE